jgi:hypothetical protein
MERMYPLQPGARIERAHPWPADAPAEKINRLAPGSDYTVRELRQLAAEHGVKIRSRATKDEIIAALTAAGVELPTKPLERMPPYRRRRGPEAGQ